MRQSAGVLALPPSTLAEWDGAFDREMQPVLRPDGRYMIMPRSGCVKLTDHSFPAIGREFGNRDHTTIMHSYVKVKTMVTDAPLLRAEIDELQESLAYRYAIHP